MFKSKKSKFAVFTFISLAILACFSPIMISYDSLFGIRRSVTQTVNNDIDVLISLNLEVDTHQTIPGNLLFYVEFDFYYDATVKSVEVESVNYRFFHNEQMIYFYSGSYNPGYYISRNVVMQLEDTLTFQGSINLIYLLNDNPRNYTANFNLTYIQDIRGQAIQDYIFVKGMVMLAYIASFILVPVILYFVIHPDFRKPSPKEKEDFEEYFDKFRKTSQEMKDKNIQ